MSYITRFTKALRKLGFTVKYDRKTCFYNAWIEPHKIEIEKDMFRRML